MEKCTTISSWGRTKKNFVLRQGHFGLRPVFGIFLAWRRPKAFWRPKKYQKRAEGQNDLAKAQNFFFVIPNDEKCRALTHELHFSTLSKFFPLQKVNFPVPKIPLGKIYFLSLLARKTRTRARMKKRAKGRKIIFFNYNNVIFLDFRQARRVV